MAEEVKSGGSDKPESIEWVSYAGTAPIDSNSWLWSFTSRNSLAKTDQKSILTSLVMILKSMCVMGETKLWISTTALQNDSLFWSAPVGSQIFCNFGLRVSQHKSFDLDRNFAYRKSFDSDQDFWARTVNHFIKIGISEWICESFDWDWNFGADSRIIWFRSILRFVYRKSFDSDRDFGACIANLFF